MIIHAEVESFSASKASNEQERSLAFGRDDALAHKVAKVGRGYSLKIKDRF